MSLEIRTNHHWRQFLYRNEVPQAILDSDLNWCDDEDNFIKYNNWYYSLSEFMRVDENNPFHSLDWHGHKGDSYFSGVLIRVSDDGEEYQIATYLS